MSPYLLILLVLYPKLQSYKTCLFFKAGTSNADFVAIENVESQMWGLQFHPEVTHSPLGKDILKNFVVNIAKAKQDWVMTDYANE